jgi:RNA polymerase subunit RPABC4/transcription elongation factor Spt4
MKCVACGKDVGDKFKFCPYCGQAIDKNENCKKCGAEVESDWMFCGMCGNKLSKQNQSDAKKSSLRIPWSLWEMKPFKDGEEVLEPTSKIEPEGEGWNDYNKKRFEEVEAEFEKLEWSMFT